MDDLGDLAGLRLLAVLGTYRRDGTVLLSPVWHEWREGGFGVVTSSRYLGLEAEPRTRTEPTTTSSSASSQVSYGPGTSPASTPDH